VKKWRKKEKINLVNKRNNKKYMRIKKAQEKVIRINLNNKINWIEKLYLSCKMAIYRN
jgi:hypothetical protein